MPSLVTTTQGLFQYEVWNNGICRDKSDWFPNLVLDSGLRALIESSTIGHYCVAGTGNSAPTPTQTLLDNRVLSSNANTSTPGTLVNDPIEGIYVRGRKTYNFPAVTSPVNITELGITTANSAGSVLFSRTLVKDPAGNPTTISLIEGDELRVTYELRRYPPQEDYTQEIDGYTITFRAAEVGNSGYWNPWKAVCPTYLTTAGNARFFATPLTSMTDSNDTTASVGNTTTTRTINPEELAVTMRFQWGSTTVIDNGVRLLARWQTSNSGTVVDMYHVDAFQLQFDPPVVKTDQEVLEIELIFSVGRHEVVA